MKKHSKVGNRNGKPAYRTPARIKNRKNFSRCQKRAEKLYSAMEDRKIKQKEAA